MNALLQIGTEHLPARFLRPALQQLKENAVSILAENRLKYSALETYGTYKNWYLKLKIWHLSAKIFQRKLKAHRPSY